MNTTAPTSIKPAALMSVKSAVGRETLGFAGAELASMAVSLGVVAVADKLIPEDMMKHISKTVSKVCIEPYFDTIEGWLGKCKLEECKIDKTKTREERAENYAKILTVFGVAWLASMGGKLWARRISNDYLGVGGHPELAADASLLKRIIHHIPIIGSSREENMILAADEGVHIGALVLLNTHAAELTDDHIKSTSNFFQKIGFSKERADNTATMLHVWEVPNVLGMLAGGAAVFGKHAYGWPTKHEHQKIADILKGTVNSVHSIGK